MTQGKRAIHPSLLKQAPDKPACAHFMGAGIAIKDQRYTLIISEANTVCCILCAQTWQPSTPMKPFTP